uniref:Zinc transporter ZIP3 n=1 Tax=Castor canadensis TaxID=51338 RepID=A0A8C0WA91_CASCN
MKLLVAKVLCMVGVFFFMLLGSLLPVKVIHTDFDKAHRSKKILSLCNTFGGGVFLATCFNALLPAVREKYTGPPRPLLVMSLLAGCHPSVCRTSPDLTASPSTELHSLHPQKTGPGLCWPS